MTDDGTGCVQSPLHHLFWNVQTERYRYRLSFGHHGFAQGAQTRLGGDAIQGREGQGADRIEADVAPQFEPDAPADGVADRNFESGRDQSIAQGQDAVRVGSVGFTYRETLVQPMFDHPGRHDLAGGIDDATDGALGSNRIPLRGARIDTFQVMTL